MEKQQAFQILNIPETKEEEKIRQAYFACLKFTNPEDDPEGFKQLRSAYEIAIQFANSEEKIDSDASLTPIEQWIQEVENVYRDIRKRRDLTIWKELLTSSICEGLDTYYEARIAFLRFLMEHYKVPQNIWKLFDQIFQIQEEEAELKEYFPEQFIDYVCYRIENGDWIEYELFQVVEEQKMDVDRYLEAYYEIKNKLDQQEFDCLDLFDQLEEYGVYHPFEDVEKINIYLHKKELDKAKNIKEKLFQYKDEPYIGSQIGCVLLEEGRLQEAEELFDEILEKNPMFYPAQLGKIECLIQEGKDYEARGYLLDILSDDNKDNTAKELIIGVNERLIQRWLGRLLEGNAPIEEEEPTDQEIKLEIAWCFFQNRQNEEGREYLEGLEIEEDERYAYTQIYGRILFELQEYELARQAIEEWIEYILEEQSLPQEEQSKAKLEKMPFACQLLGACYQYLQQYDRAEKMLLLAVKEQKDLVERFGEKQEYIQDKISYFCHLGEIYSKVERYEEAFNAAERALELNQEYYPALMIKINACYELENDQEVIDTYYDSLQIFSGYYKPYLLAAEVFCRHSQYENAKDILEEAKRNEITFTDRMKLCEISILLGDGGSEEGLEQAMKLCEELKASFQKEDSDLEDASSIDYKLAILYSYHKEPERALISINNAIEASEEEDMLYERLKARILLDAKRYEEALESYEALEDNTYGNVPSYWYEKGRCFEEIGNYEEAIALYKKIEEHEDYLSVSWRIAECYYEMYLQYYRKEDLKEVLSYFTKHIETYDELEVIFRRGVVQLNENLFDEAVADFTMLIERDGESWQLCYYIGRCYFYQREMKEAISYFKRAIELSEGEEGVAFEYLGRCYRIIGEYEKAIECYRTILDRFPEKINVYDEIGNLYIRMGEEEHAKQAFQTLYEKGTEREKIDYYESMSMLLIHQGKHEEAISCVQDRINEQLEDDKAKAYELMGDVHRAIGNFEESIHWYQKAVEEQTNFNSRSNLEMECLISYFLLQDKENAKQCAIRYMENFIKEEPQGIDTEGYLQHPSYCPARLYRFAWYYIGLGEVEKGLDCLKEISDHALCHQCNFTDCFDQHVMYGYYYEGIGEIERAIEHYQYVLKITSYDPRVEYRLKTLEEKRNMV